MTVSDLRTLVNNLDEYIHVPSGIDRLKKTVLHLAVSGQLVPQDSSEGTGEDLYEQIQTIRAKLTKKQKALPKIEHDKLPFDIPINWIWVQLGSIHSKVTDGSHNPPSGDPNGLPMISSRNVSNGMISFDNVRYLSEDKFNKENERTKAQAGDILLTIVGSIGRTAVVNDTHLPFTMQRSVAIISPIIADNNYIANLVFPSAYMQDTLAEEATGTAQKGVYLNQVKELLIPLPPLAEQKRIVERVDVIFGLIDKLDAKYKAEEVERSKYVKSSLRALSHNGATQTLENLTQTIKTKADTTELRKAILHLAVSGKLVPQIPSEGTGEDLYEQIKVEKSQLPKKRNALPEIEDNEIPFDIPNSWRWTRVSDLGSALGQKVPDKDFYYVDVASIDNSSQTLKRPALLEAKDAPSRARKIVTEGTVIFSTVRPYLLNTTVVHDNFEKELIASTAFAIIHPFTGIDSHWLLFNLVAQYFTDYTNEKSVGAAYPAINDAQFSMALIPLPPSAEQKRIVAKTTELLALVTELEKHLEK